MCLGTYHGITFKPYKSRQAVGGMIVIGSSACGAIGPQPLWQRSHQKDGNRSQVYCCCADITKIVSWSHLIPESARPSFPRDPMLDSDARCTEPPRDFVGVDPRVLFPVALRFQPHGSRQARGVKAGHQQAPRKACEAVSGAVRSGPKVSPAIRFAARSAARSARVSWRWIIRRASIAASANSTAADSSSAPAGASAGCGAGGP